MIYNIAEIRLTHIFWEKKIAKCKVSYHIRAEYFSINEYFLKVLEARISPMKKYFLLIFQQYF